ncbi:MAG: hypothetical protein WCG67_02075 [Ferruginibacter sp.]
MVFGITFAFFNNKTTFIAWHQLNDAYIRPYNTLMEYGGYGIRIGPPKTGSAINTSESCKLGLLLQFKDGRLLLIGTKNPGVIQEILNEVFKKQIN